MPNTSGETFSDENLEKYVRHFANTVYHPVGTCKMGSQDDDTAVVDAKLRYVILKWRVLRTLTNIIRPSNVFKDDESEKKVEFDK